MAPLMRKRNRFPESEAIALRLKKSYGNESRALEGIVPNSERFPNLLFHCRNIAAQLLDGHAAFAGVLPPFNRWHLRC